MAYARIEETFWHDDKIRALSEDGRSLMLYLLTCPHRNRLGCFVLDIYYAAADLQWESSRVRDALEELVEAGRVEWDEATRVLFIPKFLKHNTLENQAVVRGAIKELRGLPDNRLLDSLADSLRYHSRDHYKPLVDKVLDRMADSTVDGTADRLVTVTVSGTGNGSGSGRGSGGTGEGIERGEVEEEKKEKLDSDSMEWMHENPVEWMHEIWHQVLGYDSHPIKLTRARRQKYQAMYEEQLQGVPDPRAAWRAVLVTVTRSDHHMSQRSYQMPESILRNEERRDRWVQQAIDELRDNPDTKSNRRREEMLRALEERAT